jgi:putative oxidoreductase
VELIMAIESTSTTTTVSRSSGPASAGLLLGRIPLGLFFLLAGIHKLHAGVDGFVSSNMTAAMKFLPENLARGYLQAVPWVEMVVGILLIVGLLTRVVAAIMSLMLISYMMAVTQLRPAGGGPFHYNLVYLGLALTIMLVGPGWFSVDGVLFRPRRRVVVTDDVERRTGP